MKKNKLKFKSEDAERQYWATHSPLDEFDSSVATEATFSNLKPTLKSISIRLPEEMIDTLKVMANRIDVPYQSLVKLFLAKQIEAELYTPKKKGRLVGKRAA